LCRRHAADDDAVEESLFIPEIQKRAPKAKTSDSTALDEEEYEKVCKTRQISIRLFLAPFVKRAALKGTVALRKIRRISSNNDCTEKPVAVVAFGLLIRFVSFPSRNYVVAYASKKSRKSPPSDVFGEVSCRKLRSAYRHF
jgi:hypothetical protein